MTGDTRYGLSIYIQYSIIIMFFFEKFFAFVPKLLGLWTRSYQKTCIPIIRSNIIINEFFYVDLHGKCKIVKAYNCRSVKLFFTFILCYISTSYNFTEKFFKSKKFD